MHQGYHAVRDGLAPGRGDIGPSRGDKKIAPGRAPDGHQAVPIRAPTGFRVTLFFAKPGRAPAVFC